jgi:hypothetical protein
MVVTADDVAEFCRRADEHQWDGSLAMLESIAEILAYTVAVARAEGADEVDQCDQIELLVRSIPLSQAEITKAEWTLRALGYVAVCDRLRQIAPHAPRPRPKARLTFMQRLRLRRASRLV